MILTTNLLGTILSAALIVQGAPATAGIRSLARDGPPEALIVEVQDRPNSARRAFRDLLALAAPGNDADTATAYLIAAESLANAFIEVWQDSFPLRQLTLFRASTSDTRSTKILADSTRRMGNQALSRDGVAAAMSYWRESLRLATLIRDSAEVAASLGNLGAGFWYSDEPDSAAAYYEQSRHIAQAIGDLPTAGNAIGMLASISAARDDLQQASELFETASVIRRRIGDARGAAADLNNLGDLSWRVGDTAAARQHYEAALSLNRAHGQLDAAATNLINLAALAADAGEYAEAVPRYREALAIYEKRGERYDAAFVWHSLGRLKLLRGDYPGALRALTQTLEIYEQTGTPHEVAAVRSDLARAHVATGDPQQALNQLRTAEELLESSPEHVAVRADLALTRADLSVQFNMLAEAERTYRRAERLYRTAGQRLGQAEAQQGIGFLYLLREDYIQARRQLDLALRIQQTLADPRPAALTQLLMGYALEQMGDTAAARLILSRAATDLGNVGDQVAEAAALASLADLERNAGLTLAAESLYQRGLRLLANKRAHDVAWRLHYGLGLALRARHAYAPAAAALEAAIQDIEQMSSSLYLAERRAAFLANKWEVYAELAVTEESRGRAAQAFEVSERLRARQMLDLLVRGSIAPPRAADAELTAKVQDLRAHITALTDRLVAGSDGAIDLRGLSAVEERAGEVHEAMARAQSEYARLLLEMREVAPDYASLLAADIVPWREVVRQLPRDAAILEYLITDASGIVFVITSDGVAAIDLAVTRPEVASLVSFARGTLARARRDVPEDAWRAPMRRLYQYLVAPIEEVGVLRNKRVLLIAAHAELHYLPFEALIRPETEQFLIDHHEIVYVPSASVWLRLRERSSNASLSRVLALAPRARTLPGSREEVEAIARLFGDAATVLTGPLASESAFRDAAPDYPVVHLASYGVLNKQNPLFSFVDLQAGGGHDGRLEVHEVFGLGLNAGLLVLSACQTALGSGALADVPEGDDWVGLVRAFLTSGANNVLATLWAVEDRATALFMERFYDALRSGLSPAESLAIAKRESIRDDATAHPFYWAGFVLVGGA